jgi:hypothetical protein
LTGMVAFLSMSMKMGFSRGKVRWVGARRES